MEGESGGKKERKAERKKKEDRWINGQVNRDTDKQSSALTLKV